MGPARTSLATSARGPIMAPLSISFAMVALSSSVRRRLRCVDADVAFLLLLQCAHPCAGAMHETAFRLNSAETAITLPDAIQFTAMDERAQAGASRSTAPKLIADQERQSRMWSNSIVPSDIFSLLTM